MIVQVFDSRIAINSEVSDHVYGIILKKDKNTPKRISLFKRRFICFTSKNSNIK